MRTTCIVFSIFLAVGISTLLAIPECNRRQGKSVEVQKDKILLRVDLESEKQLQAEVDTGHQPWRLNAVDVAAATLSNLEKREITADECTLESATEEEAIVKYTGQHLYNVRLKRLVRPKGIWTAVEIAIE